MEVNIVKSNVSVAITDGKMVWYSL